MTVVIQMIAFGIYVFPIEMGIFAFRIEHFARGVKMLVLCLKVVAWEVMFVFGTQVLVLEIIVFVLGMKAVVPELKMIAFGMRMFVLGMFVFGMRDTEIGMKGKSKLKSRDPLTLPWLSSTHYQRIASIVHPFPLEILQQCAAVEMVYQDDQLSLLSEKDSRYAC